MLDSAHGAARLRPELRDLRAWSGARGPKTRGAQRWTLGRFLSDRLLHFSSERQGYREDGPCAWPSRRSFLGTECESLASSRSLAPCAADPSLWKPHKRLQDRRTNLFLSVVWSCLSLLYVPARV
eukprot:scaffold1239_cov175-Pinguiococcus_pyrenoidosus.AAC.3